MARLAPILTALLLAAAPAALSACGEEDADLLPGETAREITANLDSVQQLADEGDCLGAESAAQQVTEQVEALGGVEPELKEALRDGSERLNEVVSRCEEEVEVEAPPEEAADEEDEDDEKAREKEEKELEKEEKEREREAEQAEREGEKADQEEDEEEPESAPPEGAPEPEGEAKGQEGGGPPGQGEEPSGGVGPGSPVGEGD